MTKFRINGLVFKPKIRVLYWKAKSLPALYHKIVNFLLSESFDRYICKKAFLISPTSRNAFVLIINNSDKRLVSKSTPS